MPSYLHLCCTTFYYLPFLLLITSPLFDDLIVLASNVVVVPVYLSIIPSIQFFHLSIFHFFSVSLSSSFSLSLVLSLSLSLPLSRWSISCYRTVSVISFCLSSLSSAQANLDLVHLIRSLMHSNYRTGAFVHHSLFILPFTLFSYQLHEICKILTRTHNYLDI